MLLWHTGCEVTSLLFNSLLDFGVEIPYICIKIGLNPIQHTVDKDCAFKGQSFSVFRTRIN